MNLIKILQYHNKVDNLLLHVLYVYIGRAIIIISVIISISGGLESKHYSTCTRNGVYVYSCARTRTVHIITNYFLQRDYCTVCTRTKKRIRDRKRVQYAVHINREG